MSQPTPSTNLPPELVHKCIDATLASYLASESGTVQKRQYATNNAYHTSALRLARVAPFIAVYVARRTDEFAHQQEALAVALRGAWVERCRSCAHCHYYRPHTCDLCVQLEMIVIREEGAHAQLRRAARDLQSLRWRRVD